jgi:putative transposase
VFTDAIVVKVRDGQVANRPVYAAIGVTLAGEKDVLGLWAGTGGEGAKFWMSVLTDLKNRGIKDVFFVVCDGLKGLPDVVVNAWPQAIVQTCIVHYADVRIMPISRGERLVAALRAAGRSA